MIRPATTPFVVVHNASAGQTSTPLVTDGPPGTTAWSQISSNRGRGTGERPRFRTNPGRGRGSVPAPGQIGDGGPVPVPRQIWDGDRDGDGDGDGDRGVRALTLGPVNGRGLPVDSSDTFQLELE